MGSLGPENVIMAEEEKEEIYSWKAFTLSKTLISPNYMLYLGILHLTV